jgi:hypothetical protein
MTDVWDRETDDLARRLVELIRYSVVAPKGWLQTHGCLEPTPGRDLEAARRNAVTAQIADIKAFEQLLRGIQRCDAFYFAQLSVAACWCDKGRTDHEARVSA